MIFLNPKNLIQYFIQRSINIFFRFKISIKKKLHFKVRNNLFISGDFFESLSKINNVKKSSNVIFSTLENFPQKKNYSKLKNKIWIFHNSDKTFDLKKKKSLDLFKPKKCYSQNLTFKDRKYHFLPIGLENDEYYNNGDIKDFLKLRKIEINKTPRVLFGFNITNPKRVEIKKNLKLLDIADETKGWNSYFYRRILLKYMFVICPEGNGIDTHRLWEALYLKTIPIMKKNKISPFIQKINLPILVLNKWTDLLEYDEKKLKKLYSSKKNLFNNKYLFQNYWKRIITKEIDTI